MMSDEIRDLDDVEALVWANMLALCWFRTQGDALVHADGLVRLLRERRQSARRAHSGASTWDTSAHGRSAERAAVVAWLLSESDDALPSERREGIALLEAARKIERGEHDR